MPTIGGVIKLEGESEYRKALTQINASLKATSSELKLLSVQYDKNDDSVVGFAKENEALGKQMDAQKQKIATLRGALEDSSKAYGENDARTQRWKASLLDAETELVKMQKKFDSNNEAVKNNTSAIENLKKGYEKIAPSIQNVGSHVADATKKLAKSSAVATAAVGAIAVKITKKVVTSFAELEQSLGGSESVFGDYAKNVQKYGEEAYKNLGISQTEYLNAANKMGALLQGSAGFGAKDAADMTADALTRAADVASIMGVDTASALEAVTAAAKGNFTMMDNLGVAMSDTTLKAYAEANGLGEIETTADKVNVAMKMFMDTTSYAAGNFEKESTQTISGSIGLLTSSVESFVAGLGNADADIGNLTENVVTAFKAVVTNVQPVIETLVSALPQAIDAIVLALTDPTLVQTLIDAVVAVFNSVLVTLTDSLPKLLPIVLDAVLRVATAVLDNLPQIITALLQCFSIILETLSSPQFLPKIVSTIINTIPLIIKSVIAMIPQLVASVLKIGGALIGGLWDGISNKVEWIKEKIKGFGTTVLNSIKDIFGIHSPSRVMRDQVGKNLALGIGEGFTSEMSKVNGKIAGAIETDYSVGINASASGSLQTNYQNVVVSAFKEALKEFNADVVLDDKKVGSFVLNTVNREVFA